MGNLWKGGGSKVLSGLDALAWLKKERKDGASAPAEVTTTQERADYYRTDRAPRGPVDLSHINEPQPFKTYTPPESDTWTCQTNEVTGKCPILDVDKTTVRIPYPYYFTWQMLAGKHKDEWFAYVTGDYDEATGNATIDGFYFPPQRVSGAHCEPIQGSFEFKPRTIGSVHSHNTMGAFFSGTDLAHMNWQVEMVINAKGDMVGKTRVKFECGKFGRYDATLKLIQPAGMGEDEARELSQALKDGSPSPKEPEKEEEKRVVQYGYGHGYYGKR